MTSCAAACHVPKVRPLPHLTLLCGGMLVDTSVLAVRWCVTSMYELHVFVALMAFGGVRECAYT